MTRAATRYGFAAWMALLVVLVASSCQRKSEIVLVIDTDLIVPTEIDRVEISVAGTDQSAQPIAVDLTSSSAPSFPLTLGLVADNTAANVVVSVVAKSAGVTVVAQSARTNFVDGEKRMLRMLLLLSCLPVACSSDQTCGAEGCGPIDRASGSLPPWIGTSPPRPVRNVSIGGRTVWASGWHSAAVQGQSMYGWGQNADGQLGNGTTQNANSARRVMNVQTPASVGVGQLHTCICDQSKQAWCWGRNGEGQLGTGNLTSALTPTMVPDLNDCEQIAGGSHHTCAVRSDKTVWCWGQNGNGQVGQPAGPAPVTAPQMVPDLSDVVEVQCGEFYTCARRSDGAVLCWGKNDNGQLGDGTTTARSTPAAVMNLPADVAEVVTGRFFACVRRTTGEISCWGSNSSGQLGVATPATSSLPLAIAGIDDALQLTAGHQHACFIHRATGVLSCWGGNQSGQLGDGTTNSSLTPVDVLEIVGVTSVAAGSQHTCARHSKGVSCWGDNLVNQLGDGGTTNRSRPVTVSGL